MDPHERRDVHRAGKLPAKLVYEVIRRDGAEELERPLRSLVWSGIAAGIVIAFSVIAEAVFRTYLPSAPSSYLIENIGYTFGFLLVILGRMQLFTENTITTVLPLMARPSWFALGAVARLWAVVLAANVVGAFAIAALMAFTPAFPSDLTPALVSLSEHATGFGPVEGFARAIPAGILVAAIVWMMPASPSNAFAIIFAFTWLIAAGDFTHVVAGSVEMAYLVWLGDLGLWTGFSTFFVPVLLGNIVGGTVVFALMAWGQVKDELSD
ncbi:MAG: formate/nitrite transporter family protein [Pseudomonadota bacterium]